MDFGVRHWLVALAAAAAIHVGIVWLVVRPPARGPSASSRGVEVALLPAGRPDIDGPALQARSPAPAEGARAVAPETVSPVRPRPAPEAPTPPPAEARTVTPPAAQARAAPVPEAPRAAPPERAPAPAEPPRAEPPPQAEPEPAPPRPPERAAGVERDAPGQAVAKAPQEAGRARTAEPRTGGEGPVGDTDSAALEDYRARVRAWLERHKEYPRRAQRRLIEGRVVLRIVVDRRGEILSYEVEQGSGYPVLDEAARRMVERAGSLPAMPGTLAEERLELIVPVRFRLR